MPLLAQMMKVKTLDTGSFNFRCNSIVLEYLLKCISFARLFICLNVFWIFSLCASFYRRTDKFFRRQVCEIFSSSPFMTSDLFL